MGDKRKNDPSKVSLILRIVVSAYLLYLVWGLRDAPAAHTGLQRLLFIAAMIVFAAVAVILGGMSIKAFLNGEYDRPDDGDGPES